MRVPSHVIGVDDAPFPRATRGDVLVVGAVFSRLRLDGVLSTRVRRDGRNATERLVRMVGESRFAPHLQLILLQGIALAGFNVVDVRALSAATGLPVLVIARNPPRYERIRRALLEKVRGGTRKWRLIETLGPMEPMEGVMVQRWGIDRAGAAAVLRRLAVHGRVPEPLRTAHLIAGGIATGESRHRV